MGRTKPGNAYYATPRELRVRKPLAITISDEAREILEAIAEEEQLSKSQVVEQAIKAYETSRSHKST